MDLGKLSPSARKEAIAGNHIALLLEAHLMQKNSVGPQPSLLGNAARLAHAPEVGVDRETRSADGSRYSVRRFAKRAGAHR